MSNIDSDFFSVPTKRYLEKLEARIEELEDKDRFLNSCNQELVERVSNLQKVVTHFWLASLSDQDKMKAISMIRDKTRTPSVHIDTDYNLKVLWDGLTIDEIDIKDVIE